MTRAIALMAVCFASASLAAEAAFGPRPWMLFLDGLVLGLAVSRLAMPEAEG